MSLYAAADLSSADDPKAIRLKTVTVEYLGWQAI